MAAVKYHCPSCLKNVAATTDSHYYRHDREKGTVCSRSKRDIPAWLLRRGPETGPDDDVPVKGRDYADCPRCPASPVLDGATGCFADHLRDGETPTSKRVPCPGSGQPYESGESECHGANASEPDSEPATPAAARRADSGPSEAEEMISKWAATARKIENRELPPPSPESTTTPTDSPQQQPCRIAAPHPPHKWMRQRRQAQCPGMPAPTTASTEPAADTHPAEDAAAASRAAPSSTTSSEQTPPDIKALATAFPKQPPGRSWTELPPEEHTLTDAQVATLSAAPSSAPAAEPSTAATPPTPATAPPSSSPFAQPGSPFSQPGKVDPAPAAVPMTVRGEQLAATLRQLFFDYDHRRSADNRGAQTTLGPSEIGTPCDRRLAMALLGVPAVHAGGDGWAAFVGTAVHEALARMFQWADAGSGRYAVEVPLTFPSVHVPRGTADLLDRTACMVDDHKIQGKWSQNKLRTEGIPPRYRVQLHTYGFGQRMKGEVVDFVALISWPRETSSLDDLYVIVEPYDPAVARDALNRVEEIAADVKAKSEPLHPDGAWSAARPLEVARTFSVADDCRFCPFHAPGDAAMERGCNGRT